MTNVSLSAAGVSKILEEVSARFCAPEGRMVEPRFRSLCVAPEFTFFGTRQVINLSTRQSYFLNDQAARVCKAVESTDFDQRQGIRLSTALFEAYRQGDRIISQRNFFTRFCVWLREDCLGLVGPRLALARLVSSSEAVVGLTPRSPSFLAALPTDVLSTVFSYLGPEELGRQPPVCKRWRVAASEKLLWDKFDLKTLYPGFNDLRGIWGGIGLEAHGLSAIDAPSINNRTLIPIVRRMSRSVEGGAGVTVFIKPKGCSLNTLLLIAREQGVPIKHVWDRASTELGEVRSAASEVVVMTNSVFLNSRDLTAFYQQALVNQIRCEMPDVVSAVAFFVLTCLNSPASDPTRLFYIALLPTYTRCQEEVDRHRLVVGGFSPPRWGMEDLSPPGLEVLRSYDDHEFVGVGGLWKFKASGD